MVALPNEILCMIIGFLKKKDLLLVRLVNKIWQFYAEDYLRATYFTVKNNEDISQFLKLTSWRNFENTIPPYVRFDFDLRFHCSLYELSNEILQEFISKYGNVIQGLSYNYNYELVVDMRKLLMNTPNIQEIGDLLLNYSYHENDFDLPKLRIFDFDLTGHSANFLKKLLNTSPNVQKINLCIRPFGNFQDIINVLHLISSKSIKVKVKKMMIKYNDEDCNENHSFKLQSFQEIVKVNLIITALDLIVSDFGFDMANLDKVQESIEEFMEKLSENLKHLKIYYSPAEKKVLLLHFKTMKKLETVELRHSCNRIIGTLIEAKFGFVPLLKTVKLKAAVLNFQLSVPLLKHLDISSDTISDCLHSLRLLDEKVRLETLSLVYKTAITQKCIQELENFLIFQGTNIKNLSIVAEYDKNIITMDEIELPRMEKLQKLKLIMKETKVKLQQSHFPNLQILRLHNPSQVNHNESMENIQTLIIRMESIPDFVKTMPQFPNLKKLRITSYFLSYLDCPNETVLEYFRILFKNMTHIKELHIDFGGSWQWDAYIGNSEVVNFLSETSIEANWTLNSSFPNLGDLIALESLKLDHGHGQEHIKAVAYLILCGKLTNLKYFEARTVQSENISLLAKIFTSNNIKINFN